MTKRKRKASIEAQNEGNIWGSSPPPPFTLDDRVLAPPYLDGVVNERDVDTRHDREHSGDDPNGTRVGREHAQDEVAPVEQKEHERRGELRVPHPRLAPRLISPQRPGDEHEEAKEQPEFSASARGDVPGAPRPEQVDERGARAEDEPRIGRERGRDMDVEDLLDDSHHCIDRGMKKDEPERSDRGDRCGSDEEGEDRVDGLEHRVCDSMRVGRVSQQKRPSVLDACSIMGNQWGPRCIHAGKRGAIDADFTPHVYSPKSAAPLFCHRREVPSLR